MGFKNLNDHTVYRLRFIRWIDFITCIRTVILWKAINWNNLEIFKKINWIAFSVGYTRCVFNLLGFFRIAGVITRRQTFEMWRKSGDVRNAGTVWVAIRIVADSIKLKVIRVCSCGISGGPRVVTTVLCHFNRFVLVA